MSHPHAPIHTFDFPEHSIPDSPADPPCQARLPIGAERTSLASKTSRMTGSLPWPSAASDRALVTVPPIERSLCLSFFSLSSFFPFCFPYRSWVALPYDIKCVSRSSIIVRMLGATPQRALIRASDSRCFSGGAWESLGCCPAHLTREWDCNERQGALYSISIMFVPLLGSWRSGSDKWQQ